MVSTATSKTPCGDINVEQQKSKTCGISTIQLFKFYDLTNFTVEGLWRLAYKQHYIHRDIISSSFIEYCTVMVN